MKRPGSESRRAFFFWGCYSGSMGAALGLAIKAGLVVYLVVLVISFLKGLAGHKEE